MRTCSNKRVALTRVAKLKESHTMRMRREVNDLLPYLNFYVISDEMHELELLRWGKPGFSDRAGTTVRHGLIVVCGGERRWRHRLLWFLCVCLPRGWDVESDLLRAARRQRSTRGISSLRS